MKDKGSSPTGNRSSRSVRDMAKSIITEAGKIENEIPDIVGEKSKDRNNIIGKYVLVEQIGTGGMGRVFRGYDTELKRFVALKIIEYTSEAIRSKVKKEAETLAKLSHPNIVPVYDTGIHNSSVYIAMKHVEGNTLEEIYHELNINQVLEIISDVCDAIAHANSMGIIHRDLKPQNIMVDSGLNVYITDFGIAKNIEESMTQTSSLIGSPSYMAPEQINGETVGPWTDVYAIGVTIYHCLTGELPFEGASPSEILSRILQHSFTEPSKLNNGISKGLQSIIKKSMHLMPRQRYSDAVKLKDDIDKLLSGTYTIRKIEFSLNVLRKYKDLLAILLIITAVITFGTMYIISLSESRLKNQLIANRTLAMPHFENGKTLYDSIILNMGSGDRNTIRKNLTQSVTSLEKAIWSDPSFSDPYAYLGQIALLKPDLNEAISHFSKAIERSPATSNYHYLRVIALHRKLLWTQYYKNSDKRLQDAEMDSFTQDLEIVLGSNLPGEIRNVTEAFLLMAKGGPDEKIMALCDSVLRENPDNAEAIFIKIKLLYREWSLLVNINDTGEAAIRGSVSGYLKKLLTIKPGIPPDYYSVLKHCLIFREHQTGLQLAQSALKIMPEDPVINILTAGLLHVSGDKEGSMDQLQKAASFADEQPSFRYIDRFYFEAGFLFLDTGNPAPAKHSFMQWHKSLPEYEKEEASIFLEDITSLMEKKIK